MRPQDLYSDCMTSEKKIEATNYRPVIDSLLLDLIFLPVFEPTSLLPERFEVRPPFGPSISEPLEFLVSEADWRYSQLLKILKKQTAKELRLLLIARWLKQEGVCRPEHILSPDVLRKLIKRFRGRLNRRHPLRSAEGLRHAARVRLWLRYFQRLLADLSTIHAKYPADRTLRLEKLGYESSSIKCSLKVKSPIRATCKWLGERGRGDARTLYNAYSRIWSASRKNEP